MRLSLALLTGYAALAAADCLANFDFPNCVESAVTVRACSIGFVDPTAACSCSPATIESYCAVAYCSGDVTSALTNLDGDWLVTMSDCATKGITVPTGILGSSISAASASTTEAAAGSTSTSGLSSTSNYSLTSSDTIATASPSSSKAVGNPMVTQAAGRAIVAAVGIVRMIL